MAALPTGEPVWGLSFDQDGGVPDADRDRVLAELRVTGVRDLFVFSHGWNTSSAGARDLYAAMFPLIRDAAATTPVLGPIGFIGVFWPSLWFPATPATTVAPVGSQQSDPTATSDASTGVAAISGTEIAADLSAGFTNLKDRRAVERLGAIIDEGLAARDDSDDRQRARLEEFQATLDKLASRAVAPEDAGETALLFSPDPVSDYRAVAERFGSAPPGSSTQGLGDWVTQAFSGAKDVLRVFSFNVMKARAGVVGQQGLGRFLTMLQEGSAGEVRVHLIGHSFGARLVSFALAGIGTPEESPVRSLLLIQGAFSHWSFAHAQDNPFGEAGALHQFADRVPGARAATFSVHDWAVCRWYPAASFLAGQDQQGVPQADRWGGMGSDGFQAVSPAADQALTTDGPDGPLTAGTFHRVDAQDVICDVNQSAFAGAHSDIRKPAVGRLAAAVAAAGP